MEKTISLTKSELTKLQMEAFDSQRFQLEYWDAEDDTEAWATARAEMLIEKFVDSHKEEPEWSPPVKTSSWFES